MGPYKIAVVSILSTEKLGHSFNDNWLFKDLSFSLHRGDRVALVGVNGTGKSSLLRILAGELDPTKGLVVTEKGITIGFLDQNPDFKEFTSVNDFIYSADNAQQNLIRQYEELLHSANPDHNLLQHLTDEISAIDAWEYEYKISSILTRLGIVDFDQGIVTLSGGQRKRLALAKLLIDEPDIYVLDEPTNHLDIETIEWLEKILITGNRTVLLVTHDRYFLDAVCTEVRELDRGIVYNYKGGYSYFLEKKNDRESADQQIVLKSRNLLRKELEWMRRQPKARGTKSKARIEAFHELEKKAKEPLSHNQVQLSVKIKRQGSKILELHQVSKSFGDKLILDKFDYIFKKGDRIGLAGKNGTGKTTFINLLTGIISTDEGTIERGETLTFGYYKQEGLDFSTGDRVIDIVKNVAEYITLANGDTITVSQLLTLFLFPPQKQFGFVDKLSGGERKRLQLMRVLMQNPNFLILDEPTNDLDIDTLNVLEDFLISYPGILILVSHDRYLLDKLTEQLFIFEGEGNITIYNGNYADYKIEQEELAKEEKRKARKEEDSKPAISVSHDRKKLTYKEQQEYTSIEKEISQIEADIKEQSMLLQETSDHMQLVAVGEKISQLNIILEEKTNRWIELAELA